MKRFVATAILVIGLTSCKRLKHENVSDIELPSAELIGCSSFSCSHLWQDNPAGAHAIYPEQVNIDIRNSCPVGIVARYDKTVLLHEIKAAIDQRYGKWAAAKNEDATVPVKLWRVEPKKFAIQLGAVDKEMEAMTLGQALAQPLGQQGKRDATEEVAKQVIYLAFGGSSCSAP